MKRKLLILGLAVVMTLSCTVMAFATSYSSTLSICGNSTATGKTRSYKGATHNIAIVLSSMGDPSLTANYCKVCLNNVTLTGTNTTNTKKLIL